jgi:peptide deformylase
MIVPIISYGHKVLRQVCREVEPGDPDSLDMMVNLTDTLDAAEGVGLAAPQINMPVKMFMVDTLHIYIRMQEENRASYFPEGKGIREIFINARITKRSSETAIDTEGCLSIPAIFEEIQRSWQIEIEYLDNHFQLQSGQFSGLTARAIQHEIDHTRGILFVDHLSPLKKRLLANKLRQISKGKVSINYPMKFTG